MLVSDPYDYPRCEICRYCEGANKCTFPGTVKMGYDYMKPAGAYDSYCDKFEKDQASLDWIHASVSK